ncbi:MAG: hypothetical protein K6G56_03430 [Clostridiales bacterium]|nr:hypothetical protein [Clostridiales bacterium]
MKLQRTIRFKSPVFIAAALAFCMAIIPGCIGRESPKNDVSSPSQAANGTPLSTEPENTEPPFITQEPQIEFELMYPSEVPNKLAITYQLNDVFKGQPLDYKADVVVSIDNAEWVYRSFLEVQRYDGKTWDEWWDAENELNHRAIELNGQITLLQYAGEDPGTLPDELEKLQAQLEEMDKYLKEIEGSRELFIIRMELADFAEKGIPLEYVNGKICGQLSRKEIKLLENCRCNYLVMYKYETYPDNMLFPS